MTNETITHCPSCGVAMTREAICAAYGSGSCFNCGSGLTYYLGRLREADPMELYSRPLDAPDELELVATDARTWRTADGRRRATMLDDGTYQVDYLTADGLGRLPLGRAASLSEAQRMVDVRAAADARREAARAAHARRPA